jgi:hypothetical protein
MRLATYEKGKERGRERGRELLCCYFKDEYISLLHVIQNQSSIEQIEEKRRERERA